MAAFIAGVVKAFTVFTLPATAAGIAMANAWNGLVLNAALGQLSKLLGGGRGEDDRGSWEPVE